MAKDGRQRPEKISGILAGIAGEHLVAGELTSRGYIAAITLKNTKSIDILATNESAAKVACIQVKASQQKRNGWILNQRNEDMKSPNLFYVFIRLNMDSPPDFYVVPSAEVADAIAESHRQFVAGGGKDNPMREFSPEEHCRNNWDILGL
jgi:hypothetical protein